jgi:hypothetical protein
MGHQTPRGDARLLALAEIDSVMARPRTVRCGKSRPVAQTAGRGAQPSARSGKLSNDNQRPLPGLESTLYELTKLTDEQFDAGIKSGIIERDGKPAQ